MQVTNGGWYGIDAVVLPLEVFGSRMGRFGGLSSDEVTPQPSQAHRIHTRGGYGAGG